jgi:hypothetical protein
MVERDNTRARPNDGVDASDAISRALEELCACVESVASALPLLRPHGLSERLGRVRALAREARMGTAARPRSEPRDGSTESEVQRPYRGESGGQSHV